MMAHTTRMDDKDRIALRYAANRHAETATDPVVRMTMKNIVNMLDNPDFVPAYQVALARTGSMETVTKAASFSVAYREMHRIKHELIEDGYTLIDERSDILQLMRGEDRLAVGIIHYEGEGMKHGAV